MHKTQHQALKNRLAEKKLYFLLCPRLMVGVYEIKIILITIHHSLLFLEQLVPTRFHARCCLLLLQQNSAQDILLFTVPCQPQASLCFRSHAVYFHYSFPRTDAIIKIPQRQIRRISLYTVVYSNHKHLHKYKMKVFFSHYCYTRARKIFQRIIRTHCHMIYVI